MYALLCNYAREKDHCWPSQTTLAGELGCSVSSVKTYLGELQSANLIQVKRDGRFRSSVYYMLKPSSSGLAITPPASEHGASSAAQGNHPQEAHPKASAPESESGYQVAKNWLVNNLSNLNSKYPPLPPVKPSCTATASQRKHRGGGDFLSANSIFERLWAAYPRKEAKELARRAWHRLWRRGALPALDALLAVLDRLRASTAWLREHGRFVPQLVNWLRGQRWLDDLPPAADAASSTLEDKTNTERLRLLNEAFAEQEKRRNAASEAETAPLRPAFDSFLACFADGERLRGPAWGLWVWLHKQGRAPLATQVHEEEVNMGIIAFLQHCKMGLK